jgi:predicted GIY-YIG superfamily endonuclease
MSYCYLLYTNGGRNTYIGATLDPNKRLRQHNGEITGGARTTSGKAWTRALIVGGFPDWSAALQFEWSWKRHGRKLPGLVGKQQALLTLLESKQSTKSALPFACWPQRPFVINELNTKIDTRLLKYGQPTEEMPLVCVSQAEIDMLTNDIEMMMLELAELMKRFQNYLKHKSD